MTDELREQLDKKNREFIKQLRNKRNRILNNLKGIKKREWKYGTEQIEQRNAKI